MIKSLKERTNNGFEIQFYDVNGNHGRVIHCDTVEELAQYLARGCWGNNLVRWDASIQTLPTIWKDGKHWCHCEYTEP